MNAFEIGLFTAKKHGKQGSVIPAKEKYMKEAGTD